MIEYGILSSQANPFDPMEKAITYLGDVYLKDSEHLHSDWEIVKEYPLSKELLAMSRVFTHKDNSEKIIAAKGAPETIFDLCHLSPEKLEKYTIAVEQLASSGLRVLGVAKAKINSDGNKVFVDLVSKDFIMSSSGINPL